MCLCRAGRQHRRLHRNQCTWRSLWSLWSPRCRPTGPTVHEPLAVRFGLLDPTRPAQPSLSQATPVAHGLPQGAAATGSPSQALVAGGRSPAQAAQALVPKGEPAPAPGWQAAPQAAALVEPPLPVFCVGAGSPPPPAWAAKETESGSDVKGRQVMAALMARVAILEQTTLDLQDAVMSLGKAVRVIGVEFAAGRS